MNVRRVGVLGAGTMGRGIAYVCSAMGGYDVVLFDPFPQALEKAKQELGKMADGSIERGKLKKEDRETVLNRIRTASAIGAEFTNVDFVIEAVPEDIKLKIESFQKLDSICQPATVYASNTSSLSITEMAAATRRPAKFIGMHFFNPVPATKLVEIIRAKDTDDATVAATEEISKKIGKETVIVKESPGFVTTRINALIGNEAFWMLHEGLASAQDIDKALKLGLNHPMGPFELVDLVGLDVRLNILKYLHKTLGEKYRPCPLIEQYVKEGRLGRKTGRGVYEYPPK
jgi:3-hydroxybutyryl-CoA dehydrogenase